MGIGGARDLQCGQEAPRAAAAPLEGRPWGWSSTRRVISPCLVVSGDREMRSTTQHVFFQKGEFCPDQWGSVGWASSLSLIHI